MKFYINLINIITYLLIISYVLETWRWFNEHFELSIGNNLSCLIIKNKNCNNSYSYKNSIFENI